MLLPALASSYRETKNCKREVLGTRTTKNKKRNVRKCNKSLLLTSGSKKKNVINKKAKKLGRMRIEQEMPCGESAALLRWKKLTARWIKSLRGDIIPCSRVRNIVGREGERCPFFSPEGR